jgi:hypothetical protein
MSSLAWLYTTSYGTGQNIFNYGDVGGACVSKREEIFSNPYHAGSTTG